jgi:hypothetical protein
MQSNMLICTRSKNVKLRILGELLRDSRDSMSASYQHAVFVMHMQNCKGTYANQ